MVWSTELRCWNSSGNVGFLLSCAFFSLCTGRNMVMYMSNVVQQPQGFLMVWWMMAMECIWSKDLHEFLNFQNMRF